jgi:hypothetical protein
MGGFMVANRQSLEPHLSALRIARKKLNRIDGRSAKVLLLALLPVAFVFLIAFRIVGFENTIFGVCILATIVVSLVTKSKSSPGLFSLRSHAEKRAKAEAQALKIENILLNILLQRAVSSLSPWLKLSFSAPPLFDVLKTSGLLAEEIHSAKAERCLAGLYEETIPVCAAYVSAERTVTTTDSDNGLRRRQDLVFQGLVVLIDAPLASPGLAQNLIATLQEKSKLAPTLTIKDGTLIAAIPMKKSPFQMTDNEAIWETDLAQFLETVGWVTGLTEALHAPRARESEGGSK